MVSIAKNIQYLLYITNIQSFDFKLKTRWEYIWIYRHFHCSTCASFKINCYLTFFYYIPALGAAYGTAKSGTGIAAMAVMRPEQIMKSIIPVVMAGIIAIYGLVVAVLIAGSLDSPSNNYTLYRSVDLLIQFKNEYLMLVERIGGIVEENDKNVFFFLFISSQIW